MSEFDCVRFVYSSSATVYGTPPIIPIPESTRLKADSPYGKSKIMSETIVHDLCQAEPDRWRAISLRYFKCVIDGLLLHLALTLSGNSALQELTRLG